jgi:tetratricopeptide (TPR) repeat protein
LIATILVALSTLGAGPDLVEPTELAKRPELVGREVLIDDRVLYFLESKRGQGYDQLVFKRTGVVFRLPSKIKFARPPSEANARVKGILKSEDGRLVVEVSTIEMLPGDLERLENEIGRLRREDWQGKRSWALWAERRGKELNEPKLEARGVVLETEALWLEASRPETDPLGLVARISGRPIAGEIRNALAHRGFRDRLAKASTVADLETLAGQVESTLPASKVPGGTSADPETLADYAKDPGEAYRAAPEGVRTWLDRRLLADIRQRSLEKQLEASPNDAAKLTELARELLPDRPELADRLAQRALVEAEGKVASMRQSEVEELASTFRDRGENDRARKLIQSWLADRRKNRLSASDAEGRILLASNYDKMLGDRATAAELLREALAIDPSSKLAADAFLRMGYRRGESGWYDPDSASTSPSNTPDRAAKPDSDMRSGEIGNTLRGLTRAQVRSRLGGKPDQIVRSASQGRCVELWIYKNGKGTQVIRFLFEPNTTEPRASNYYADQK